MQLTKRNNNEIKEELLHELALRFEAGDVVGVFCLVLNVKDIAVELDMSGDIPMPLKDAVRREAIVPTFIEIGGENLSDEDKLRLASSLVDLGRRIRRTVLRLAEL